MKILFVNEIGGLWGGVEQNILLSIEGLSDRGHECFLYAQRLSDRGVERFESVCSGMAHTGEEVSISDYIRKIDPDVIYLHKYPDISEILTFADRYRIVRMVHDHDLYCPRRHKYFFHNRRICHHAAGLICYADLAFLERKSDGKMGFSSIRKKISQMRLNKGLSGLIVGSTFMREQLVANGFDVQMISQLAPAVRFGKVEGTKIEDTKKVLYVGQLIRGKGVDLLLQAFEQVDRAVSLDIVGQGNDLQMLQQLISDNPVLSGRVTIHGWIDHQELVGMYDKAMITVVPSRWPEPFGMVGLEAMLRSRPVVAFDVGGIPDWLDDGVTGYLVPEADTQKMAERINELISDIDLVRKMGREARKEVTEKFSFDEYMKRLEMILQGEGAIDD